MSMPARRWDCHVHAFGPISRFPAIAARAYEPPEARPADLVRAGEAAGLGGRVWVQPSIYGDDNAALLAALGSGSSDARGVIAPPAEAPPSSVDEAELRDLHARGVRGLRLNLVSRGGNGIDSLAPFRGLLPALGWHVAAFLDATDAAGLESVLAAVAVPVVLDHFGWPGGRSFPGRAAFRPMLRHVEAGRLWVKLSAPYQICGDAIGCAAAAGLAGDLVRANPDRILFASNWPYVGRQDAIALGDLVARTEEWIAAAGADPSRIFTSNAQLLYN